MWLRQLCWAHLQRAFVKFSERKGNSRTLGHELLAEHRRMFHWWHKVRDGTMTRAAFIRNMRAVRRTVESLLRGGRDCCTNAATRATCREILRLAPALWTFVTKEGVEPTNNNGERPMRQGVLWRRVSHGCDSHAGSRFVERMLTVTETLRQHRRNVLDYLTAAVSAHHHRRIAPSLIPSDLRASYQPIAA